MKRNATILFLLLISVKSMAQTGAVKATLVKLMNEQQAAWNKGDIDGFMTTYWQSDSLKFIGKNGLTYGWQKTLDNYKKNYPDKATLGTLTFDILSVEQLSATCCYVIGKWHLTREKGDVGGHYTLLWKLIDGKWVIVADHTS